LRALAKLYLALALRDKRTGDLATDRKQMTVRHLFAADPQG
jgi:hypothetical protein